MTRRSVTHWSEDAEFQEVSRLATEVKPKSNRILLIFGVFLAIVAFGGALLVGRTSGGNIAVGGSRNVPAGVAVKTIPGTTQIKADMVPRQRVSAGQGPAHPVRGQGPGLGQLRAA